MATAARLALVIGIDDYREVPKLQKAVGDAETMSATLEKLGFQVTRLLNADRRELNIAISQFSARLTADDIAFVHFSGHGVEIAGENYLLPADIPKPQSGHEDAVKYEAIALQRLIGQIAASGARTRLFVIDACRNNPFEQTGVRSVGSARGLAYVAAPAGTFVMYSAGYGQLALDRLNNEDNAPTSIYTRVLAQHLLVPGKSVAQVAQDVRGEVQRMAKSVGHNQRPAYYDELSANLVLNTAAPAPAEATGSADEPTVSERQIELTFWNSVKDQNNRQLFELYLQRYPYGSFAPLARLKISELTEPSGTEPVESEPASPPTPSAAQQQDPETLKKVAYDLQRQLNRLGCSAGTPDGIWGRNSSAALRRFARYSKKKLASYEPSTRTLSLLKRHNGRVCPCPNGSTLKNGKCYRIANTAPEPSADDPPAAPAPRKLTYKDPAVRGLPLDICVTPLAQCKGEAANRWCKARGYAGAESWTQIVYPKTRRITGTDCVTGGFLLCAGYNRITCVR